LLLKLYALFPPTSLQALQQQVASSSPELRELMVGSHGSVEAFFDQSRNELWLAWLGFATLFALGLASGAAALRSVRGWWSEPGSPIEAEVDADDALVLSEALAGGAEVFITGDAALVASGEIAGVPIVSPRQFWERLHVSDR
jgi:hypothetical protein